MLGGHDTLRTPVVKTAFGAMVVGVTGAKAVHLVLRRHHEAAFTAADESGIGKVVPLPPRPARSAEKLLDLLEFGESHHGIMLAGIGPPFPLDDSGIEGVREDLVDRAREKWRTTDPLTRPDSQAPLLCGDLPKPLRRIGSGQHH